MKKEAATDTFQYVTYEWETAFADFQADLNSKTFREVEVVQIKDHSYNTTHYYMVIYRMSNWYNEKVMIQNNPLPISTTSNITINNTPSYSTHDYY
jgi:hypothetical protein